MRCEMPPQSAVCSPKRSVSVSSLNVVSMTPARVQPTPRPYASARSRALPDTSWWTASSAGTPGPWVKRSRITWPGALGAIIVTSTSGGGTTWLKWILKPWANISILPLPRPPRISDSNTWRWLWSGSRVMMTSAAWAASFTVATRSPSFSAFAQLYTGSKSWAKAEKDGLRPALRALVEPDHDALTRVLQIQRVRVPLAAVADDRERLALEQAEIGVLVVVDLCGHLGSFRR